MVMLAMQQKPFNAMHDIAYYAKDSRLTGEPDGKRYQWKEMIERFKLLGSRRLPMKKQKNSEFHDNL